MIDPISLTAASLQADMQRMSVSANNSANVLTPGYKRGIVAMSNAITLAQAGSASSAVTDQPSMASVYTDFKPGAPHQTGNPLDICLLGEGFFEVTTDSGVAYTRQGTFHVDETGRLVSQAGLPVAGTGGNISLATDHPMIDRAGNVFENGKAVAQLKVVSFDNPTTLQSAGGGLFIPLGDSPPRLLGRPQIAQGQLESSNVDSATEMVRILETYRHFEGSVRVLQAYDDLADKTFRSLGQF